MTELFDDDEDKVLLEEDLSVKEDLLLKDDDAEALSFENTKQRPTADARRRLEDMLEEKRLRDELEDFADY
jgi:hypothetical protein